MKRLALLAFAIFVLALLPAAAQGFFTANIPPSVTSVTPSNRAPGIPPSVTSARPNWGGSWTSWSPAAWNASGFHNGFGSQPQQPLHHHHHHFEHRGAVPVYVPYYYGDYYDGCDPANGECTAPGYAQPQTTVVVEPEAPAQTVFENRPGYQAPAPGPISAVPPAQQGEAPPAAEPQPAAPQPQTVLVFKDGRKIEVGNYAIVGDTLYVLSNADHRYRIALADLDLKATVKANEDRGIEFDMPDAAKKNPA